MSSNQHTTNAVVVTGGDMGRSSTPLRIALFNEDGTPWKPTSDGGPGGGNGEGPVSFEFDKNYDASLGSSEDFLFRVVIEDDGSSSTNWPDRFSFSFNGHLVSWFNEVGEFRLIPGKSNTVPLRIYQKHAASATRNMDTPLIEVARSRDDRTPLFSVESDGSVITSGSITSDGPITQTIPGGPVLQTGYLELEAEETVPSGTPAGTLIVRKL